MTKLWKRSVSMVATILLIGSTVTAMPHAGAVKVGETRQTISAGFSNTAAIDSNGSLWIWGSNEVGQLGNGFVGNERYKDDYHGELYYQTVPQKILDNVISVDTGEWTSGSVMGFNVTNAAIKSDGTLWAWGAAHMIGNGSGDKTSHITYFNEDGDFSVQSVPLKVLDDVTSVSVGGDYIAAVKKDNSLWLVNGTARSNDGTTEKIMDDVASVAASSNCLAIIKKDGSLWLWGDDSGFWNPINGKVQGLFESAEQKEAPFLLKVMDSGASTVNIGAASGSTASSTVAVIKTDGSLWMWGENGSGQLGVSRSTLAGTAEPQKVMDGVSAVSVSGGHTAAVKTDGSLWTWGSNRCGELGNGTVTDITDSAADTSAPIKIMDGVLDVDCGNGYTIAKKTDGTIWAWGNNSYGQIGNNGGSDYTYKFEYSDYSEIYQTVPVQVSLSGNPSSGNTSGNSSSNAPSEAYYEKPVKWAVEKGISVADDGEFNPDADCPRAQIITFIWRTAGSPSPANAENPFSDVSAEDPFYNAVLWASSMDIANGKKDSVTGDLRFAPNDTVTRAETVTFLHRAAGLMTVKPVKNFSDVKNSDYFYDAVMWAVSQNITNGTTASTFSPNTNCTTGQILTFLYRANNT